MIKIIQINSYSGFGGGERVMFNIIEGLKNSLQFIIAAPEGEFLEEYQNMNLKVCSFGQDNFFKNILKIKKIIQKERPEILHCQGTRAAFWVRIALIGLKDKPKLIYTLHGFHIIRRNFFLKQLLVLIERFLNHWTDVLVCVSEADKKLVLKYQTIFPEKIKVIKNGIDIEKFQIEREFIEKTRKELGLEDRFVLTIIARLHPPKDISTILQALKLIILQIQNVKLLIVGDGPLRKSLEKEARDLSLGECVKFLGWREDVVILTNLSQIMILSSKWEALGLVCLEAGACRKPIIASNIDGVREAVVDEKTGYLFKPGSPEDLAEKILKLYHLKELREQMGKAGFEFVSQNFSKQRMIEEYQDLYYSL